MSRIITVGLLIRDEYGQPVVERTVPLDDSTVAALEELMAGMLRGLAIQLPDATSVRADMGLDVRAWIPQGHELRKKTRSHKKEEK